MISLKTTISGSSRVCFIIGQPINQVRTPSVFNDWAERSSSDIAMLPLEIGADGIDPFFASLRHWTNCPGVVVTYPYKQTAYRHLDEATPAAQFLQACNVIHRAANGRLCGAMTDGLGYAGALERNGIDPKGTDFLLIGAGGAGSAIAYEMARKGVSRLTIGDLDQQRVANLIDRLSAAFPNLVCATEIPDDFAFDIACNATPVGMSGDPNFPIPLDRFTPQTMVTDIVPAPAVTPWLQAAADKGLRIQTGPEMVEGQFTFVLGHLLGEATVTA